MFSLDNLGIKSLEKPASLDFVHISPSSLTQPGQPNVYRWNELIGEE